MEDNNKSNNLALAGLLCSIFLVGIIGTILSIMGLKEAKETNNGKGLAIAGIVIGSIKLALITIMFVAAFLFSSLMFPSIEESISKSTYCSAATECEEDPYDSSIMRCTYFDENGESKPISCPRG